MRTVSSASRSFIQANGVSYALPSTLDKAGPRLLVCLSGTSQEYIDNALHKMPLWNKAVASGGFSLPQVSDFETEKQQGILCGPVAGVIPATTLPNNASILSGQDISRHNVIFPLDELKADSVLQKVAEAGRKVLVSCESIGMSKLLGTGLKGFENAKIVVSEGDALDPLETVIERMERDVQSFDLAYIALGDSIQHRYPPHALESIAFYEKLDTLLSRAFSLDSSFVVTSDHGMQEKTNFKGEPRCIDIEKALGGVGVQCRVRYAIEDGEDRHAMGSCAFVWLEGESHRGKAMDALRGLAGVYTVLGRDDYVRGMELHDVGADILVIGDQYSVVSGGSWDGGYPLRSHGGLEEQIVPFLMMSPVPILKPYRLKLTKGRTRNFDAFDFLMNGLEF